MNLVLSLFPLDPSSNVSSSGKSYLTTLVPLSIPLLCFSTGSTVISLYASVLLICGSLCKLCKIRDESIVLGPGSTVPQLFLIIGNFEILCKEIHLTPKGAKNSSFTLRKQYCPNHFNIVNVTQEAEKRPRAGAERLRATYCFHQPRAQQER